MANDPRELTAWTGGNDPADYEEASPGFQPGQLGMYYTVKQKTSQIQDGQEFAGRDKRYQIVVADSSMSVAPQPGSCAYWSDKTRFKVTTDPSTLGLGARAGIFTKSVAKGNLCVIQTKGPRRVRFVAAPTANPSTARLAVIPSSTVAKADCLAAGTAPTYPVFGWSAGAYDLAAQECTVDLDIPDYA